MKVLRWFLYLLGLLLLPGVIGGVRLHDFLARKPAQVAASSQTPALAPPQHAPDKPTVVVVLAADVSEITDVLGPYEMFARAKAFNVYAVAPSRASVALTGGLRMRPHYSFAELDELLEGSAPSIVVTPNLPNIRAPENRPVVDWVRRSASRGAISFSWCAGAAVLAEAGLLDGRTATSHWGDLARLERDYPRVNWVRGTRWIDHGNIVTSAGITSGIDATLRVLIRLLGEDTARRVARELNYPNYHFAEQPLAEQYVPRAADAVLFLNAAFKPRRERIGLVLYEGVGELDVSAFYDAHAATAVATVSAIGSTMAPIVSAHGLVFEPAFAPGHDDQAIAEQDRFIVPGREGQKRGASVVESLRTPSTKRVDYLQAENAERFSLEPAIEDLARTADRATATFALRRLEYRSNSVRLDGKAIPVTTLLSALSLSLVGALLMAAAIRVRRRTSVRGRFPREKRMMDLAPAVRMSRT